MRIFIVVHGFVQGVGYRNFVREKAVKLGIKGMVRNNREGSVEILADGDPEALQAFEEEINVDLPGGPQVMHIEKRNADDYAATDLEGFAIWHTA